MNSSNSIWFFSIRAKEVLNSYSGVDSLYEETNLVILNTMLKKQWQLS